jgi:hypothetical protein
MRIKRDQVSAHEMTEPIKREGNGCITAPDLSMQPADGVPPYPTNRSRFLRIVLVCPVLFSAINLLKGLNHGVSLDFLREEYTTMSTPTRLSFASPSVLPPQAKTSSSPSRATVTTEASIWDQSTILPQWMKDYVTWHHQVRKSLNTTNWEKYQYLVLRCLRSDHVCGGASDRLQPVPLAIRLAQMSQRVLFIYWDRPAHLEEFLVPPTTLDSSAPGSGDSNILYGLDWRVPSFLMEPLSGNDSPSLLDLEHRRTVASHPDQALRHRLKGERVVGIRLQFSDGGSSMYNSFISNVTEDPTDPSDQGRFDAIYHETWRLLFAPAPPVAELIDQTMGELDLQPNNYTAVHVRSLYVKDTSSDESMVRNAVNCGTTLQPDHRFPIYVASDSPAVVAGAVEYGKSVSLSSPQVRRRVVGRINGTTPLHIDRGADFRTRSTDWTGRPPSDFYDVFVDLYLLGQSSCVAHNIGGYGKWGNRLSFNHSCTIKYTRETCSYSTSGT